MNLLMLFNLRVLCFSLIEKILFQVILGLLGINFGVSGDSSVVRAPDS